MDRSVVARLSLLGLMLTFACSGEQSGDPVSLIRLEAQPPGPNCSSGGTAVYSGMDDNGDGELSDAEIDQTVFVCNGSAGRDGTEGTPGVGTDALVRMESVATGTICAYGGLAVFSGSDLDRDGVLDDNEVTSTEYVCDSPGALIRTATVATGTVCRHGGVVIHSGSDLDGDGTLDANEITNSEYLCNTPPSTNGTGSLVRLEPVPTGTVCPSGGVAIHTGPDLDANGLLESDEITDTEYVCYGQSGGTGANGLTALVRLEPVPTGTICPNGGVAVQTGTDLDNNGQLEPAEVTGTQYVCYGADGQAGATGSPGTVALIRLDDVTTGTVCSGGGVAVHSGLDLDGDGVLSNNEITDTDYVCSGTPGQTALLRLDPVPAGAYCTNGGVAVNAGLDRDGDGYLDNEEITDTEYICNGTSGTVPPQDFQGSFVIRNSLDVSTIMPYTSISGSLTIEGTGLSAVNLPNLTNIGGDLIINNTGLTDLMMNALATVGGRIEIKSNSLLTSFSFAALTSAGELQIWQNAVLPQIVFPSLLTITAECRIDDNDQLTLVRFASATQLATVVFFDNDALNIIDFPALTRVTGDMTLYSPVGCLETFPSLTAVDGTLTFRTEAYLNQLRTAGAINASPATSIDTYDFTPALETVTNDFQSSIRHIYLPSLRSVGGGFHVSNAVHAIETLSAPMLDTIGGDFELSMAAAATANLPALISVSGLMWVISGDFHAPNLSHLENFKLTGEEISNLLFPSLSTVVDMNIYSDNLVSVSLPALSAIQGMVRFYECQSLQSVTTSATTINNILFYNTNIRTFDAPLLTTITDSISTTRANFTPTPMSSFTMPNWTTGGRVSIESGPPVLSFPLLTSGEISIGGGDLTSLSVPNLSNGNITVQDCPIQAIDLSSLSNGTVSVSDGPIQTIDLSSLVSGDVLLRGLELQSVSLPNLTSGAVRLYDLDSVHSVSVPSLTSGAMRLSGLDLLPSVSLPSLTNADVSLSSLPLIQSIDLSTLISGDVTINDLPLLTTADLSNLTAGSIDLQSLPLFQIPVLNALTDGDFYLREVHSSLSAPVLQSVGTVEVWDTSLTSIDMPSLVTGDTFYLRNNLSLSSITMPNLQALSGRLYVFAARPLTTFDVSSLASIQGTGRYGEYGLELQRCHSLTTLSAPVLQSTDGLYVRYNNALSALNFPNLASAGSDLLITDNSSLPTCDAQALVDQLIAAGWSGSYTVTPNATPSCP